MNKPFYNRSPSRKHSRTGRLNQIFLAKLLTKKGSYEAPRLLIF